MEPRPADATSGDIPDISDGVPTQTDALVARARALVDRPVPPMAVQRVEREPLALPALPALPARPEYRVGLVLAGGAAKGAYQVGAVQRLAEEGIELTAVAGTSIGALNAAVLASSPDLAVGAARLTGAWEWFTGRFGEGPFGDFGGQDEDFAAQFGNLTPRIVRILARRGDLEQLVRSNVIVSALRGGIPCRVAVYPVEIPIPHVFFRLRAAQTASHFLRRWMGLRSRMVELNRLPEEEVVDTVLGSAALPFLFPPRSAGSGYYRDGFLGGDNTPIRALADIDHCDIVVVVHLSSGETLRREEHEGLTLLQIRPSQDLVPAGPLGGLSGPLDFSPSRFRALYQQGYWDADAMMGRVNAVLKGVRGVRQSARLMAERVQRAVDGPCR
ncbi:patatin-like phospholipase family protein [Streptomyces scabiei]|uniref:patatin-like phospholipase family protein n=1 Tax=Streptomyces scabiei TaxID=1930 RepID=UPI00131E6136|nr:patatin-like phospholipase family protein [Streptomyces scabiei]